MYDVLIIGSGPAGLTASIYAARAGKKTGIIMGLTPGGQLTKTTHVENYPGFEAPIMGPDLMLAMQKQAQNCGVELIEGSMERISGINPHFEIVANKKAIKSRALIIATGAEAKLLGIEKEYLGYGVSTCATCDGAFFKNQKVAIIGGGNSALEEALYLSNIASKVFMIHRRKEFRGEKILQNRVMEKKTIEILWPFEAVEVIGQEKPKMLKALKIRNLDTQNIETLELDGLFIAIGHKPNTEAVKDILELNEQGFIKSDSVKTQIPGLFIAGDVFDDKYRQAITAAGFGCMAAIDAIKYLD